MRRTDPDRESLTASLPAAARDRLAAYLDLLAKWNRVYNLTAIRDRARMETHHVQDALAVLPFLPDAPKARVLDVGSGGGLPGIPLAIARPDWRFVLLDANRKKAAFLAQAAIELELANVRVVASRVEDLEADEPFDIVISRAFSDLRTFAKLASRHVAPNGILVAMKGALPIVEIDALPRGIVVTAAPALDVPGLGAERHLVVMRVAQEGIQ
ncbi:MAG TPA: 16S rRNA (guanine(527)-N(7))-methyltransferase RsmG [Casimicrobiaceae bacterium]|nr:16S rRNA (guanine(527)-N(7))-methyltransferase RsmG [Casimicrobiaceae bacterium]